MKFRVNLWVTPRSGILDPQGQAIEHALADLGFVGVAGVRVGRAIALDVDANDSTAAESIARKMCDKLLANPVTEEFTVTVAA